MAGLEGDVQVPAVGKVPKKVAVGSVVVVGVLVAVYYVRKKNSASAATTAAAAATSADQYPPDGTTGNPQDPYSTDPATGETYGDESVGSGLYGAYGTGAELQDEEDNGATDTYPWDGTVGDEADPYSLDPATGVTFGDEGLATGATPPATSAVTTNAEWEQSVLTGLPAADPSIDVGALDTALGLYLNGQPVSAAQQALVFQATGFAGDPPVDGPAGYPPAVRTNGETGPAPGGGTVTVPGVVSERVNDGEAKITAAGLVPNVNSGGPRNPKDEYTIWSQTPGAGKKVAKGSTVDLAIRQIKS